MNSLGRARSVAEANSQLTKQKPELLLLDVNLPDGSGLDVLRRLRAPGRGAKVILLTAGMDDFAAARRRRSCARRHGPQDLRSEPPHRMHGRMSRAASRWIDPEIVRAHPACAGSRSIDTVADPARTRADRACPPGPQEPRYRVRARGDRGHREGLSARDLR